MSTGVKADKQTKLQYVRREAKKLKDRLEAELERTPVISTGTKQVIFEQFIEVRPKLGSIGTPAYVANLVESSVTADRPGASPLEVMGLEIIADMCRISNLRDKDFDEIRAMGFEVKTDPTQLDLRLKSTKTFPIEALSIVEYTVADARKDGLDPSFKRLE